MTKSTIVKLGQLVYTSCRKGLGNGAGLQTQAISSGVSPEQRDETEALSGYSPPDVPIHATIEELRRLCPPDFRFTKFDSGRSAFSRLVYVGADYSGRHGNFIAHSLLNATDELPSYPIDWAEYQGWVDTVSDEPPKLEDIVIDNSSERGFTYAVLSDFIRDNPIYASQLPSMLHAVIISREENRPIVICDHAANATSWVACLTKLFPRNLEPVIEFSTFSNSLSTTCDVQCTTDHSDFDLSEAVSEREAYVFDFLSKRFSSLPQRTIAYAQAAADSLLKSTDELTSFLKFAEQIDGRIKRDEIDELFRCYASLFSESGEMSLSVVETAIRVIERSRTLQSEVVERLTKRIEHESERSPSADRAAFADILAVSANRLDEQARSRFAHCVERLLWSDLKETGDQWAKIDASLESVQGSPSETLADEQISMLAGFLSNAVMASGETGVSLEFVHRRLRRHAIADPWLHESTLAMIAGAIRTVGCERVIAAVFERLPSSDAKTCAELSVELSSERYSPQSLCAVGHSLGKLLDLASTSERIAIRNWLSQSQANDVLLAEANDRLRTVSTDVDAFLKYIQEVDENIDSEFSLEIQNVFRTAWKDASQDARDQLASWLIQKVSFLERIDNETRIDVLTHLDSLISLVPKGHDAKQLADLMAVAANTLEFSLPPLARVRRFMQGAASLTSVAEADYLWNEVGVELIPEHYDAVAIPVVEALISHSDSVESHWNSLRWCQQICDQPSVLLAYKKVIQSRSMLKLANRPAVAFALAAIGYRGETSVGESESQLASGELMGWLKSLPNAQYHYVADSVAKWLSEAPSLHDDWRRLCLAVAKSRGSLFRRASRALGIPWWQ